MAVWKGSVGKSVGGGLLDMMGAFALESDADMLLCGKMKDRDEMWPSCE